MFYYYLEIPKLGDVKVYWRDEMYLRFVSND